MSIEIAYVCLWNKVANFLVINRRLRLAKNHRYLISFSHEKPSSQLYLLLLVHAYDNLLIINIHNVAHTCFKIQGVAFIKMSV